jgi:hypothetical protein
MTAKKALGNKAKGLFSENSEEWGDLNGLSSNLIVKTDESEVFSAKIKDKEVEVKTEDSKELSLNSEVKTEELIDNPGELQVQSSELRERDLGVKAELSEELSIKSKEETEDLIVNPEESEVLSAEAKEGNLEIKPESFEDLTLKSEVKSEELMDKPAESQVLSLEDEEDNLRVKVEHSPELSLKSEVKSEDSKLLTSKKAEPQSRPQKARGTRSRPKGKPEYLRGLSLNEKALESAIEDAKRNPRIGIYSPISSAVLKYNKKTVPEFSISDDARLLLEDSLARKYPELARNLTFERATPRPEASEPYADNFNMDILNRAAAEAAKNPKLTVWSPYAYAIFKYLRKTMPEFSMSQEASSLLNEAVARKYSGLFQALRDEMGAV